MIKFINSKKVAALILVICGLATAAQAQEGLVEKKKMESKVKENGWHPKLSVSGNISINTSDKVIGQPSGDTATLGLNVDGGLGYKMNRREWRQSISIKESTSKSPSLPTYVKSSDSFKYETIYLYGLEKYSWIGPYAKATVQTSLFKGEDVRTDSTTTYTGAGVNQTGSSFKLTDPFRPISTKESIGFFATLKDQPKLKVEARLGVGGQQVKADDQYSVDSYDSGSKTVTLKALDTYSQAGAEFGLYVKGKFDEKSSYSAAAELFQPINPNLKTGDTRKGTELLDSEITAKVTTKVYEWMSLSAQGKYLRQPRLQDEEQKSFMLLLNFTHTLF